MPKGTILDLNVACIAMALCLDSGGERVTHGENLPHPRPTTITRAMELWRMANATPLWWDADTESTFSEIARELAAEVWGVSL